MEYSLQQAGMDNTSSLGLSKVAEAEFPTEFGQFRIYGDTVEANHRLGFDSDLRDYALPGAILRHFGLSSIRLMSNNPEKVEAVEKAGVRVTERVPVVAEAVDSRQAYLRTKREKMGHLF